MDRRIFEPVLRLRGLPLGSFVNRTYSTQYKCFKNSLLGPRGHPWAQFGATKAAITSNEIKLKVRDFDFTYDTVAQRFRDGSSLMRDLRSGSVHPEINLKPLKVYHWPSRGYYCLGFIGFWPQSILSISEHPGVYCPYIL